MFFLRMVGIGMLVWVALVEPHRLEDEIACRPQTVTHCQHTCARMRSGLCPPLVPEEASNHSYVMMRSSRPVPALGARGGLQALMHFDEIGWVAQESVVTTRTQALTREDEGGNWRQTVTCAREPQQRMRRSCLAEGVCVTCAFDGGPPHGGG